MSPDQTLRSQILETLARHHTMTLATIRPDGFPQATTVNYINDGFTIYFAADAASQKAGNIALNDKVSVAIADQTEDFNKLRGLSLSGFAKRIVHKEKTEKMALSLFQHIPQSRRYVPEDESQIIVVEITPIVISLVDYSEGFGSSALLKL